MKLKFAGFVRGLLGQRESTPERPVASQTPPPAAALPNRNEPATTAANAAPTPAAAPDAASVLQLPLAPIVSMLPMDLKAKLMCFPQPGQTITLPVDTVINQLAFGAVKITFGELRRLSPGLFANSGGENDSRQVCLPLQDILARINPTLLSRRSTQKVEVAEEVAGPFENRGRGVTFTTQPVRSAATAAPVPEQPITFTSPVATPPAAAPSGGGRSVKPEPHTETFTFNHRQVTPSAPIAFTPIAPVTPPPAKPAPTPPPSHSNGSHSNGNGNGNGSLPPFKFSTTPNTPPLQPTLPRPQPQSKPAPIAFNPAPLTPAPIPAAPQVRIPSAPAPAPGPLAGSLTLTLDDLSEAWPEEIKNEILSPNLMHSSIVLPLAVIEPGLKRGRVSMTWKEIRILARPSSAPSVHDSLTLDLPLKVIAPAFIASLKTFKRQAKVLVPEEIPNLFFGFPQAAPEPVAPPPPTPMPLPAAQPLPPTTATAPLAAFVPAPLAKPADTNFFPSSPQTEQFTRGGSANTDFTSRTMHPKDVVAHAITFPGVAGAVVTLADGLRVASEIPADLNADAVAAFLPQIYERVNQSTRELRMGSLNNVGFTVGTVAWKIYRINSIYFAAFGHPGQSLPKAQLAALASELDRKKQ